MKNKYEVIIDYIEELVMEGKLKQGQRLPSIRSLAEKFNYNKTTVIRAYKELEINHRIYSIPKGGYYLVEKTDSDNITYDVINFSEAIPDPKLLPYKEFNHCINRAVELYKNKMFSYSEAQGLGSLRKTLVNHFAENQIFTSEGKIFITSGAQQALSILANMSFPNGKKNILVEQPTYSLIQRLVELGGNRLIGINRSEKGIDFQELEKQFKDGDIKFFYTIPRLHNPLGTSYSEKEKQRIVELAEKYDVYIVEDDYLADIDTNKKCQTIYYYDMSEKVVYVKSYSKAFMPGIRIGAVVLHEKLIEEFLKHKRYYDLNTSVLAQGALEIFINSGMYKNHIKKARLAYRKKMDCLRRILGDLDRESANKIDVFIPDTGFFVWVKLDKRVNANILTEKLAEEKRIFISPAKEYFIGKNAKENSFRICISKLTEDQIKSGISMILNEINR